MLNSYVGAYDSFSSNNRTNSNNVWFKKTGTIRSSVLLLWIVPVFLNQTLCRSFGNQNIKLLAIKI